MRLKAFDRAERQLDALEAELGALRKKWLEMPTYRKAIFERGQAVKAEIQRIDARLPLTIRELGPEESEGGLIALLGWLQSQLNVFAPMTADQLEACAAEIAASFGGLRLEDVAVCFRAGLRGEHGELTNRLDAAIVLGWLRRHQVARRAAAVEQNEREHASWRGSPHDRNDAPSAPVVIDEALKNFLLAEDERRFGHIQNDA